MDINHILQNITPIDENVMLQARKYNDSLIKPFGSLGQLEEIAIQIAGITGQIKNDLQKKAIIVMCADNGVYEEKVSTAPQEVTAVQSVNMLKGKTGVSVLAKHGNIDLRVIDIGINADISYPGMISRKIAKGTKNIAKQAAMTQEELEQALDIGFSIVKDLKEQGYTMIGTGEMGISNTTTAESVIISLTNASVEKATGKGAGLTEELYEHKKKVLLKIQETNKPMGVPPLEVVRKVGGFDIAGLVGCFLGAAYYKIPIVIDGVISIAAALVAYCCNPLVKGYLLPSHASAEPSYEIAAKKMGLSPYFHLDMRLGEGSGCPFTMHLADAAMAIVNNMATFAEGKVDPNNYIDIRENVGKQN